VRSDPARAGEALDLLDRAARFNPSSTIPRLWSAEVLIAVGQPELAAPYYRDAIARDPADEYSHLALAALESTAGRRAEAERLLRRAVRLSPRDPLARELLDRVAAGRRIGIADVRKDFTQRRQNREQ
jgi:tetratricopeptide (TPR) repeat protein